LSKRFAERLLQSFQKLSGRLGTLSCSSAADSACKRFDFPQAVSFGLAAASDVAKRMM
jgi:hypothetical protein